MHGYNRVCDVSTVYTLCYIAFPENRFNELEYQALAPVAQRRLFVGSSQDFGRSNHQLQSDTSEALALVFTFARYLVHRFSSHQCPILLS